MIYLPFWPTWVQVMSIIVIPTLVFSGNILSGARYHLSG
jgi:hypothetical protein